VTRRATTRTSEVHPDIGSAHQWLVRGTPRPKGSLQVVDGERGYVRDSEASCRWRGTMAAAMVETAAVTRRRPGGRVKVFEVRPGWPLQCPVVVAAEFGFLRPGSVHPGSDAAPVGAREPDVDKLLRNVLDAMVDAKIIQDDGLVVMAAGWKRYSPTEGALISLGVPSAAYGSDAWLDGLRAHWAEVNGGPFS